MYNQTASTSTSTSTSSSPVNDFDSKFIFSMVDKKTPNNSNNSQFAKREDMLVITKPTTCKMEVQGVENEKNGKILRVGPTPEYPEGVPYIRFKIKASDINGNWSLVSDFLNIDNIKRAWVICKALNLEISNFKALDIRKFVGAVGHAVIKSKPYPSINQDGSSKMENGLEIEKWLINVSHEEIETAMQQINSKPVNSKPAGEEEIPF